MSEQPIDQEPAPPSTIPDLRVARVIEARAHPNADRLLLVTVDAGEPAHRQVVAGIAGKYLPEELAGKHVVIVANLQPAKIRGEMSQGMLLAAESEAGFGLLLAPDATPGTQVAPAGAPPPGDQISIEGFKHHDIVAEPGRVTLDGATIDTPRLVMDRGVTGKLR